MRRTQKLCASTAAAGATRHSSSPGFLLWLCAGGGRHLLLLPAVVAISAMRPPCPCLPGIVVASGACPHAAAPAGPQP